MRLTTSKGKTYQADYGGIGYRGMFKTQIHDSRPLIDVALEIAGCEAITVHRDDGTEEVFEGYSSLWRADTTEHGLYIFILEKVG